MEDNINDTILLFILLGIFTYAAIKGSEDYEYDVKPLSKQTNIKN